MADINDWDKFKRGRWNWTAYGYEKGFPRGCQFTDIDAATEFDDRNLVIEPKHHDGTQIGFDYPPTGQLGYLRADVRLGKKVFVLYGDGTCNNPQGIRFLGATKAEDDLQDWRKFPITARRILLKLRIDQALGLR